MKTLTKKQLFAIQEKCSFDNSSDEPVDWKYEVTDQHFVKHDVTSYEFVFRNPTTNKWYMGYYSCSYNNGIEDYDFPIALEEVEKVEVKSYEWRKV